MSVTLAVHFYCVSACDISVRAVTISCPLRSQVGLHCLHRLHQAAYVSVVGSLVSGSYILKSTAGLQFSSSNLVTKHYQSAFNDSYWLNTLFRFDSRGIREGEHGLQLAHPAESTREAESGMHKGTQQGAQLEVSRPSPPLETPPLTGVASKVNNGFYGRWFSR